MKPLNKKLNYLMSEDLFEQINIDETKCQAYYKDQKQIKITIQCGSSDAFRDFDRHIMHILSYLESNGSVNALEKEAVKH